MRPVISLTALVALLTASLITLLGSTATAGDLDESSPTSQATHAEADTLENPEILRVIHA